jgi:hypothetical protein
MRPSSWFVGILWTGAATESFGLTHLAKGPEILGVQTYTTGDA